MKNKINVVTNILTVFLLITSENINCNNEIGIFYKDKYFSFNPLDGAVNIYEDMMIPYMTYIENVFIPSPNGIISKISLLKNGMIKFVTDDGITWIYERFKLRYRFKTSKITKT